MSAVLDVVAFAGLVGLAFVPIERVVSERSVSQRRALGTDLAFATLGQLFTRGVLFVLLGALLAMLDAIAPPASMVSSLAVDHPVVASALEVILGLAVFDVMGYAYHRLAHRAPLLSRLHDVHHSAETLDWLASFRQHPLEIALTTLAQNVPLVLLGIPLGSHALVVLLLRLNTVFVHSNVRVPEGPWTRWIATPRFHHRHHDRDRPAANFATLSPLLDRLFGTYDDARADVLGSRTPLPQSFVGLLLHPFVGSAKPRPAELATPVATSDLPRPTGLA
ncbi:MAG: sterol desaturase family protein [Sandaracinaceae bacterium]|nr:sterol desaturase family protein [Sandaracinaceae bacterium]